MGYFTIGSMAQDVSVKPENIKTSFDGVRSSISFFVGFTFRLQDGNTDTSFDFITINADLKLLDNSSLLSNSGTWPFPINLFDREVETGLWLNFILDDAAIFAIQKFRGAGDVKLRIEFMLTALHKQAFEFIEKRPMWSVKSTENLQGEIQFAIPKSTWIEKLLPKLGYPSFKLIEIPVKHTLINEAYDDIITEFNLAQDYFNRNDYNKCVSHCRHTLDQLNRNLIKIKNKVDSETKFKWLSTIDTATLTWIDEVDKSLTAISSVTHHPGLKKDFTRIEAESIYLVTLGLMNFVGQASIDYSK